MEVTFVLIIKLLLLIVIDILVMDLLESETKTGCFLTTLVLFLMNFTLLTLFDLL